MNGDTKNSRVADLFNSYFELVSATSDDLRLEVYKLRYQVYCLETGFEPAENCRTIFDAEGHKIYYEMDVYDQRSAHYLIRHRASGLYAATTRLILPDKNNPASPFPIENHCQLHEKIFDIQTRKKLAEVSRYAISKEFKKRAGESGTLLGVSEENIDTRDSFHEQRVLPPLAMALVSGLVQMSRKNEISRWYAVMEPALFRLNHRLGIDFQIIGEKTDYHGLRLPCILEVDAMLNNVKKVNYPIWELITNSGEYA